MRQIDRDPRPEDRGALHTLFASVHIEGYDFRIHPLLFVFPFLIFAIGRERIRCDFSRYFFLFQLNYLQSFEKSQSIRGIYNKSV